MGRECLGCVEGGRVAWEGGSGGTDTHTQGAMKATFQYTMEEAWKIPVIPCVTPATRAVSTSSFPPLFVVARVRQHLDTLPPLRLFDPHCAGASTRDKMAAMPTGGARHSSSRLHLAQAAQNLAPSRVYSLWTGTGRDLRAREACVYCCMINGGAQDYETPSEYCTVVTPSSRGANEKTRFLHQTSLEFGFCPVCAFVSRSSGLGKR